MQMDTLVRYDLDEFLDGTNECTLQTVPVITINELHDNLIFELYELRSKCGWRGIGSGSL